MRISVPRSPKKKSSKTTITNERGVSPVKRNVRTSAKPQNSKNRIVEESLSPISPSESTKTTTRAVGERTSAFEGLNIPDSTSLDLLGELYPSKGSFFDLDGKRSETGMYIPLGVKLSQDSCRRSPSVIRTISGHKLVLSPSVELDMEDDDLEDIALSQLLKDSEKLDDKKFDKLQVFHDDANEYDSEATTDSIPICQSRKVTDLDNKRNNLKQDVGNKSKSWKNHEDDILNDVLYRQSVYHPAVIRQKNQEERAAYEGRPKSRSIEDNYAYSTQIVDVSLKNRNVSTNNFKSKQSPSSWNRTSGNPNLRFINKYFKRKEGTNRF